MKKDVALTLIALSLGLSACQTADTDAIRPCVPT